MLRSSSFFLSPRSLPRRGFSSVPTPPPTVPSQETHTEKPKSFFGALVAGYGGEARRRTVVKDRWKMAIPAFAGHLCIGSPYAWSLMAEPLSRELGIVAASAGDWGLGATVGVLSVTFALQGITSALAGNWQNKVGPTIAVATAGLAFGSGLMIAGCGVIIHSLPLVYLGYGVLGGIGVGLAYTPPLQVLMEYFPDRKALASGVTIAGFGSGPLLFAPLSSLFMSKFSRAPDFVGTESATTVISEHGRLFAETATGSREVVLTSTPGLFDLAEAGYYAVGTGATGIGPTLVTMGGIYMATMLASSYGLRKAPLDYALGHPSGVKSSDGAQAGYNVHFDTVMKTPQFWALCTTFFCVTSGGLALISVAKPLMLQTFSASLPHLVTPQIASSFVIALSCGNLAGRILWPALAEKIGYRRTVQTMTGTAAGLFMTMPMLVDQVASNHSVAALSGFAGSSVVILSVMGGMYALLPAYESHKFGPKYVGANHGRMLLGSTGAAIAGPGLLLLLHEHSLKSALDDLLAKVDPAVFLAKFGFPIAEAQEAIQAGTVNIANLAALVPGITDPSVYLYHSTMYSMGFLMLAALTAHQSVKPVEKKFFETIEEAKSRAPSAHH